MSEIKISDFVQAYKGEQGKSAYLHQKNSAGIQGRAVEKDSTTSSIRGLSYQITDVKNKPDFYAIDIKGWRYSVRNETREIKILSFECKNPFLPGQRKKLSLENIKVNARPLISNAASSQRSLMAAIFFIKQIEKGQVPDANRILRLYKIHPSQHSLYEMKKGSFFTKKETPISFKNLED